VLFALETFPAHPATGISEKSPYGLPVQMLAAGLVADGKDRREPICRWVTVSAILPRPGVLQRSPGLPDRVGQPRVCSHIDSTNPERVQQEFNPRHASIHGHFKSLLIFARHRCIPCLGAALCRNGFRSFVEKTTCK